MHVVVVFNRNSVVISTNFSCLLFEIFFNVNNVSSQRMIETEQNSDDFWDMQKITLNILLQVELPYTYC